MKRFRLLFLFLSILFVGQLALASIMEDEGEYYEVDLSSTSASDFFLQDVDDFRMPTEGNIPDFFPIDGKISSDFGWRRISRRRARMHKGVDIAAPIGAPIYASGDGEVVFVGRKGGYGLTVVVNHGGELSTLYAHTSKVFVSEGDHVDRGQEICLVGSSGRSTGPHLHFEVRIEDRPVNPSNFF